MKKNPEHPTRQELIQAAEFFLDQGMNPVPLQLDSKGKPKRPIGTGWENRPWKDTRAIFENSPQLVGVGVQCGQGLVVLDFETYRHPGLKEAFRKKALEVGLPDPFTHLIWKRSSSGGSHAMWICEDTDFKSEDKILARTATKDTLIEVFSHPGVQVACPPSAGYTWEDGAFPSDFPILSEDHTQAFLDVARTLSQVPQATEATQVDEKKVSALTLEALEDLTAQAEADLQPIAFTYDEYYLTLAGLAHSLGEQGRDLAHRITGLHEKYQESHVDQNFTYFLKREGKVDRPATAQYVFFLFEEQGYITEKGKFTWVSQSQIRRLEYIFSQFKDKPPKLKDTVAKLAIRNLASGGPEMEHWAIKLTQALGHPEGWHKRTFNKALRKYTRKSRGSVEKALGIFIQEGYPATPEASHQLKRVLAHPALEKVLGSLERLPRGEKTEDGKYIKLSLDSLLGQAMKQLNQVQANMALGVAFSTREGVPLIFNATHWEELGEGILGEFLDQVMIRVGIPIRQAWTVKARELAQKAFRIFCWADPQEPEDKVLANFPNGTLEIGKGQIQFREHRKGDWLRYVADFDYQETADWPLWAEYLDRVLPDPEVQAYLAEMLGNAFTRLNLEKAVLLYGPGANGKSVLIRVMGKLFTKKAVSSLPMQDLANYQHRAMLAGKLINLSSESNTHELHKYDGALKQAISWEELTVKTIYEKPYSAIFKVTYFFSVNQLPTTGENTGGFYRRFHVVPFDQVIPEDEQDIHLPEKLMEELPGIMNWVLDGARRLHRRGRVQIPKKVQEMTQRFRDETDPSQGFLQECGFHQSATGKVKAVDLYKLYQVYCQAIGRGSVGRNRFYEQIRGKGIQDKFLDGHKVFPLIRLTRERLQKSAEGMGMTPGTPQDQYPKIFQAFQSQLDPLEKEAWEIYLEKGEKAVNEFEPPEDTDFRDRTVTW